VTDRVVASRRTLWIVVAIAVGLFVLSILFIVSRAVAH
jgi:hypothetical protein